MVSWIVATHDREILDALLRPTIPPDDELVIVDNAPTIARAYNDGTARATHDVRVYVHHDVVLVQPERLRDKLIAATQGPATGMVGIIGSLNPVVPWWRSKDDDKMIGSVIDTRHTMGRLGPGGYGPCVYLDGLLLATRQSTVWDEAYPGWHMYDHDMCQQMLHSGLWNFCLPDGHEMVRHETRSSRYVSELVKWSDSIEAFRAKWGDAATYRPEGK